MVHKACRVHAGKTIAVFCLGMMISLAGSASARARPGQQRGFAESDHPTKYRRDEIFERAG